MSVVDKIVGYPVHAVAEYHDWANPYAVKFVDWIATCGASGTKAGTSSEFGQAGSARERELCPTCWPVGHSTSHPTPVERGQRIEMPA
ncbi:hypothetical protein [Micromonospora taraxaci]|uniref:hypothetical protein n=1 Tax=Micromonospora taraxaci TaxID=1316803 RepID=UPI0033A00480